MSTWSRHSHLKMDALVNTGRGVRLTVEEQEETLQRDEGNIRACPSCQGAGQTFLSGNLMTGMF